MFSCHYIWLSQKICLLIKLCCGIYLDIFIWYPLKFGVLNWGTKMLDLFWDRKILGPLFFCWLRFVLFLHFFMSMYFNLAYVSSFFFFFWEVWQWMDCSKSWRFLYWCLRRHSNFTWLCHCFFFFFLGFFFWFFVLFCFCFCFFCF